MAKLYFFYGAVGASKSATLLTTAFNYEERGQSVLTLKPVIDDNGRTDSELCKVSSRIGISRNCYYLEDFFRRYKNNKSALIGEYDVILVDEVQFSSKECIDFLGNIVDECDIPVLCYGLRTDFKGNLFPGSERLMCIADSINEIKTMCWCGNKATMTVRLDDGVPVFDGPQVLIGRNSKYTSLCRKHYNAKMLCKGKIPANTEGNLTIF